MCLTGKEVGAELQDLKPSQVSDLGRDWPCVGVGREQTGSVWRGQQRQTAQQ